jgi:hypothetical protein
VSIDWAMVTALATALGGVGVVGTLLLVLVQLRKQGEEDFVSATGPTFEAYMSDDFQRAAQWVLYGLHEDTWRAFVAAHRGKYGERAFYRVGAFYNRVGYLVTHRLLGGLDQLELDLVAGQAIAIWQKVEPLVLEARLIENSTLFRDFEQMLPECYECYVPGRPLPPQIRADVGEPAHSSDSTECRTKANPR